MTGASQQNLLPADAQAIARAAEVLRDGGLVAVPTETVYGLAARADSEAAVRKIFTAKGRPSFNPLIVHVVDVEMAACLGRLDERAERLAARFWPGALTMVLPLREDAGIAAPVTAGLPTLALRCPDHPVMRDLLSVCGLPLAAPSANRSGAVSPTTPQHVADSLGDRVDIILDGGPCRLGLESTIVALREDGTWQVLRPGPIGEAELEAVIGKGATSGMTSAKIEAPGQLSSHYSPGKPVRLDVVEAHDNEFHIGFGGVPGDVNLSPVGNPDEAAAKLYAVLHEARVSAKPAIAVAPIPEDGVGGALRDRLQRAAADQ